MQKDFQDSFTNVTINETIFEDRIWYSSPKYLKTLLDFAMRCDGNHTFEGRLAPSYNGYFSYYSPKTYKEYEQSAKWLRKYGYIKVESSTEFMPIRCKGWYRVTLTERTTKIIKVRKGMQDE